MSLLEYKNKFSIDNPKRGKNIKEHNFFKWTAKNFYRTSYNDMRIREPIKNKNMVVPGYQGYMPGVVANNKFAHTISETSRKAFSAKKLDEKPHMYSTTGFNSSRIPKHDQTLHGVSHKFGKGTIMDTHPNFHKKRMNSTSRKVFKDPRALPKPTWRARHASIDFDPDRSKETTRYSAKASGYIGNSTLFDGTGWETEKNLHTDMFRTEYRNRFNQAKPFHKDTIRVNAGRLPRKPIVYDKEDEYGIGFHTTSNFFKS